MTGVQVTEVQRALKGANSPVDGSALAELAKSNGAGDGRVEALEGRREVEGPNGVRKELKGDLGGPQRGLLRHRACPGDARR